MAHELDTAADGDAAMFSVRQTPWHQEGKLLTDAPSLADALKAGGLDWEVVLGTVHVNIPDPAFEGAVLAVNDAVNYRATVRTDRKEVLGVVGRRYTPLQNKDAFAVVEPLLDQGLMSLETGGSLRGGRDVWMLGKLNITDPVVTEVFADEVIPYTLIVNNHAGLRPVSIMETPVRVVCANTLTAAFGNHGRSIAVKHTAEVASKLVDAATEMYAGIVERYQTVARQYRALKDKILTDELFRELVLDVAVPMPKEDSKEFVLDRAERRRMAITHYWTNGKGHSGDHSAWEAYNGLVEAIDHDADIFPVRSSRIQSLFDGSLGLVQDKVLGELLDSTVEA